VVSMYMKWFCLFCFVVKKNIK